jgi:hypothetical protein
MSLLNSASLVVTPNAYKEGTLYSVIPNSTLGDMTVVRATTATRVNSAGIIELVPYNLLTYSEQFNNAAWTTSAFNATVTANTTISPDGTQNADTVVFGANGYLYQAFAISGLASATFSIYAKSATQTIIFGGATAVGTDVYTTVNVGNGWFRQILTRTFTSGGTGTLQPLPFGNNVTAFLWGAQLVTGTLPKDYVRTETRLNIPRLDYSNGSCPSLLVEPQRTNLYNYSEPTVNEGFSQNISYESFSWANGFTNCVKFGDNSIVRARYGATVPASTQVTLSFFIIMDDLSQPIVGATSGLGDFSVIIGGSIIASGFEVKNFGNNVYRVCVTATTSASPSTNNNGIVKYTAQSNKGFRVVGWQMEVGSYATSYIPTSGSAVTRNADAIYKTGISSLINSTEGVLFVETKGFADAITQPYSTYIQLSKNGESGFNNSLVLQHRNNGFFRVYVNGQNTPDIQFNVNIDFTENHKIAVLYKLNGYKLFIDGVAQNLFGTPTQAVFSGLDNLSFDLRGSNSWNAKIKNLIVFPSALSDTELAQLTTL